MLRLVRGDDKLCRDYIIWNIISKTFDILNETLKWGKGLVSRHDCEMSERICAKLKLK